MKKLLCFFISILMILGLSSCKKPDTKKTSAESQKETEKKTEPTEESTERDTSEVKKKETLGNFGDTNRSLFLNGDLSVIDCVFDDFDMKSYDAKEFLYYLEKDVDEYNAAHKFVSPTHAVNSSGQAYSSLPKEKAKKPITVLTCSAENDVLKRSLLYATAEDYLEYQQEEIAIRGGTTIQTGTLAHADKSILSTTMIDSTGTIQNIRELTLKDDANSYRFIIVNFSAVIYGEGDIYAFSSNVVYDEKNSCLVAPAGKTSIVIFK